MKTKYNIIIDNNSATLNGTKLQTSEQGEKLLEELYRSRVGAYPKFHKMDTLSKLGFIASELLLQSEADTEHRDRFEPNETRAVIFGNHSASIVNDRDYVNTIQPGDYFPSPALFVYTLPNIVTGEVAIRNKYFGETCFYIVQNIEELRSIVESMKVQSALVGWLECRSHNDFEAIMEITYR